MIWGFNVWTVAAVVFISLLALLSVAVLIADMVREHRELKKLEEKTREEVYKMPHF